MSDSYDVVVIGGGPGGYVAAIRAAQLGLRTACIESRGALGGTCLNVGCIPSKALLESSEMYDRMRHAASYGIKVGELEADVPAMISRKNSTVSQLTKGIEGLFKKNKISYFEGTGSFLDTTHIAIQKQDGTIEQIAGKNIVIATGSTPIEIPIAKFDGEVIVSSTESLDFTTVPKHFAVIGGGVIGLELGSVWLRLGAKVTVFEAMPEILASMDEGIQKQARKLFEKQGFQFHTNTKVKQVTRSGNSAKIVADKDGEGVTLEVDRVLVAVGRRAFTDKLGLDRIGVKTDDRGRIPVDNHYRSSIPHIYAVGDVIAGAMLAHKAEEEGVACAEIIAGKPGHVNYEAVPNVIYTWPEIASVGRTEQELKLANVAYNVGQFPFLANARAKCQGSTDGFVKILADAKTDRMLGMHIIGPHASELIAEGAIAFEFGSSAEDVARSVHAHPTLAEAIKEAALAVDKRALHI